jgi:hypothetical protein
MSDATIRAVFADASNAGLAGSSRDGRALLRWLAFVCGVGVFAVFAALQRGHPGFPLDDSWIHQTVARNLVEYHVYGFLPGIHSSGSSSMFWTGVLALKYALLPRVWPWVYSAVVNGLLMGLICAGMMGLAQRDGLDGFDAWVLALAPLLSGNFLWFGLLGMEHVLFVAVSIGVVGCWFGRGRQGAVWAAGGAAAVLMAVLTMTRPEGALLALLLVGFKGTARRGWWSCGLLTAGAGVGAAVYAAVNWQASRTLLPLTMQGRRLLTFGGGPIALPVRLRMERDGVMRLVAIWRVVRTPLVWRTGWSAAVIGLGLLLLAGAMVLALLLARRGRPRLSALLVWMVALNGVYLVLFPSDGHAGRHLPLQALLFLPWVFMGLRRGLVWLGERVGWSGVGGPAMWAVGALMVVSTAVSCRQWARLTRDGIGQIEGEHGAMADWIVQHVPTEALRAREVAVFDIGRIGYVLGGSLVDLGGLTDPQFIPAFKAHRVVEYLEARQVRYVVLPTLRQDRGLFATVVLGPMGGSYGLEPLHTDCYPDGPAWTVFFATGAAWPCQTAFAIHYGDAAVQAAP